ncbi:helix-turn-helix domain-containing protein [Paenibacillus yanchengensis]|uniref:Helix-turn-helix domain-containing protein n=1 Tax=Paenibacillus yanchengensis TaxID=2035833 RepID=A0ABW4YQX4_9BACL
MKLEAINEKVPYENPLLSLRVFRSIRGNDTYINWHYHKELELLLVLDGKIEVYIGDEIFPLGRGDIFLIGTSELHRDRSIEASDYIVLQFELDRFFDQSSISYLKYFTETHFPLSQANYIFKQHAHVQQQATALIHSILDESIHKSIGYELAVSINIKQLLLLLLRNDNKEVLLEQDNFDRVRLQPVLNFVEQNLHQRISVEEVCKLANMSYFYFVKYFKKTIGLSFTEYVNYRKVKWAEKLLLTKDLSIAEVSERVGMPNMAHFYKTFKKYNDCSPKQFQNKMLQWKQI